MSIVTDIGRVDQHLDVRTINLTPVVDGQSILEITIASSIAPVSL